MHKKHTSQFTTSKNSTTKQNDKNNTENSVRWGHADEISLFKNRLP